MYSHKDFGMPEPWDFIDPSPETLAKERATRNSYIGLAAFAVICCIALVVTSKYKETTFTLFGYSCMAYLVGVMFGTIADYCKNYVYSHSLRGALGGFLMTVYIVFKIIKFIGKFIGLPATFIALPISHLYNTSMNYYAAYYYILGTTDDYDESNPKMSKFKARQDDMAKPGIKNNGAVVVLSMLLALSVCINFYAYLYTVYIKDKAAEVGRLKTELTESQKTVEEVRMQYLKYSDMYYKKDAECKELKSENYKLGFAVYTYENKIEELEKKPQISVRSPTTSIKEQFLDKYIVFVWTTNNAIYYHTYDCEKGPIKANAEFMAFNIDNAKYIGYYPCPHCHGGS